VGGEIAAVAERLRLVRSARRKFLRLWAIDQSMIEPLVDRVAADLSGPDEGPEKGHPGLEHPDAPPPDES
jgi:hypothetical protein